MINKIPINSHVPFSLNGPEYPTKAKKNPNDTDNNHDDNDNNDSTK